MEKFVIGLGKMGLNLVKNLNDKGYEVLGHDISSKISDNYSNPLFKFISDFDDLFLIDNQHLVMMLLPSGEATQTMIDKLAKKLNPDDIVIDFSNSNYKDSIMSHQLMKKLSIKYYDCGISGGVRGARSGACMMLGGSEPLPYNIEDMLRDVCVEDGYIYTNEPGSGHYLKMIHNGIEYGMMEAISEGFEMLAEQDHFRYDLANVAKTWNHGSIIESYLMSCIEEQLEENVDLIEFEGPVHASGEGKWTVEEALTLNLSIPSITLALMKRSASMNKNQFSNRALSAMRYSFGGHSENRINKLKD